MVEIPGYTQQEKLAIAERHLLPRQLAQNGIGPEHLSLPNASLSFIARKYTREALRSPAAS